jgi:hypothetical protein
LCCAPFILNALAHQQVDIIIAFLAVAGCLQLARGENTVGAVLIGLAAACKGPPLLFAPYLFFRRKWLAAGLIAIVAVGVNILPDLFFSPPCGRARLLVWAERFAVPTFYGQLGAWIGSNGVGISNQALAGTLQRIFTTTLQSTPSGGVMVTGFRQVPEALVKMAGYGLMLALLAISIVSALRGQALPRVRTGAARLPSQTALEMSAVSVLMLLMSPMSDLTHFGPLILPSFCLARVAIVGGDRMSAAILAIAAAGALLVNKDLIGEANYDAVLWAGVATWSTLALWVGCAAALAKGLGEPPVDGYADSIFPSLGRRFAVRG